MNHTFKVIRCKSTGVMMAVSEFAKSGKKSKAVSMASAIIASSAILMSGTANAELVDNSAVRPSSFVVGKNNIECVVGDVSCERIIIYGINNTSKGNKSSVNHNINNVLLGQNNSNEGDGNSVVGTDNTISKGHSSTVMGIGNKVVHDIPSLNDTNQNAAYGNVAIGSKNTITNSEFATVIGQNNSSNLNHAIILGSNNHITSTQADGKDARSIIVGFDSKVSGGSGIAIGTNTESENSGVAIGNRTTSKGYFSTAIGSSSEASASQSSSFGNNASATERNATALGASSSANAENSMAIGQRAKADVNSDNSIAIGYAATTTDAKKSVVVGHMANAYAGASSSVVVGGNASATAANSVAIGSSSSSKSNSGVAIGLQSESKALGGVAIGSQSKAFVAGGVALGADSEANIDRGQTGVNFLDAGFDSKSSTWTSTEAGLSIGNSNPSNSKVKTRQIHNLAAGKLDTDAVNVAQLKNLKGYVDNKKNYFHVNGTGEVQKGNLTNLDSVDGIGAAEGIGAIAVGVGARAPANNSIIIGTKSFAGNSTSDNAVVVGASSYAGTDGISIGGNVKGSSNSVSIGANATGTQEGVTIGANSSSNGYGAIAVGFEARANEGGIAIGQGAQARNSYGIALGTGAKAMPNGSIAFGKNSNAIAGYSMAIGNESSTANSRDVALGEKSTTQGRVFTEVTEADLGKIKLTGFRAGGVGAGTALVSVGDKFSERQIINVSAGEVSKTSTDAINGSQLHALGTVVNNAAGSVTNILGGNATLNPDGTITQTNIGGTGANTVHNAISNTMTEAKKHSTVQAGKNTKVTGTVNPATGGMNYVVDADSASVSTGSNAVTVVKGAKDANGNTDYAIDLSAKTKDSLTKADSAIQSVTGDSNITATTDAGKNVSLTLNKDITVDSVTAGTNVFNKAGLTIGDVIINNAGINAGNKVITNVAAGVNTTDAVNKGQLDSLQGYVDGKKTYLHVNGTGAVQAGNSTNLDAVDGIGGAKGIDSVAIGVGAQATGANSIAIGTNAAAQQDGSIVVGQQLGSGENSSLKGLVKVVGTYNIAEDGGNIFGDNNRLYSSSSIPQGSNASGNTYIVGTGNGLSVAKDSLVFGIGNNSTVLPNEESGGEYRLHTTLIVGSNNVNTEDKNMIFGNNNSTDVAGNLVSGSDNEITYTRRYPNQPLPTSDDSKNILTGFNNKIEGKSNVVMGNRLKTYGESSIVIGEDSYSYNSVQPGESNNSTSNIVIGNHSGTSKKAVTILGNSARSYVDDGVALGSESVATIDKGVQGLVFNNENVDFGSEVWTSRLGSVSVGTASIDGMEALTRQITNVAAGTEDTDAVNIAQLKNLKDYVKVEATAAKTTVQAGKNTKVTGTVNSATGAMNYVVDADSASVSTGSDAVTVVKGAKDADGNTDYAIDLSNKTKESLVKADNSIQSVTGDKNITVTTDGDKNVTVELNKDITVDSANIGGVTIDKGGINVNNTNITNVAAGVDKTDAVNKGQLDDVEAIAKASKTTVQAGKNTTVDTVLNDDGSREYTVNADSASVSTGSDAVTVVKGNRDADGNTDYAIDLSAKTKESLVKADNSIQSVTGDKNITVTTDGNKNVTVELNKDITVDSVTSNTINTNNITVGNVSITNEGINAGDTVITNVAAGVDKTDAVNKGQLDEVEAIAKASKSTVKAGKNTTVEVATNDDGSMDYTVNADSASVSTGSDAVTVVKGNRDADGNTDYAIDLSDKTKGQLAKADSAIQSVTGDNNIIAKTDGDKNVSLTLNKDIVVDSVNAGGVVINQNGINANNTVVTNVADGKVSADSKDAVNGSQLHATNNHISKVEETVVNNSNTINKGLNIGNGTTTNNFKLGSTVDLTGGKNITATTTATGVEFGLNSNISLDSVTTGDVSMSANGINAGNKVISNVAAGVAPTDAVNVSQLNDLGYKLDNRINQISDEANAGISSAMAMASLPQAFIPGKSMITGGMATYNGEGAVAVGLSKLSDNGRYVFKISGSADTSGNAGAAAGVGFHF